VCGLATEEEKDIVSFESDLSRDGKYIVCMDPLDGSSNVDVNVSIGTVFCIYRRISEIGTASVEEDFLHPGTEQVAAGVYDRTRRDRFYPGSLGRGIFPFPSQDHDAGFRA
jgi:fructose-1,6-bisphosphatase I